MRNATRRAGAVVATTAALGFGTGVAAGPVQAAVPATATTSHVGGGTTVNVRSAPVITVGNPSNVVQVLPNGAALTIDCQDVGGRLGFSRYADNRTWNRLTDGRWIHDAVTSTPADGARHNLPDGGYFKPTSTIPRCGAQAATRESRAVDYARSQLGNPKTGETSDGMWSGWCELLVEVAYGTRGQYPSAIAHYEARRGEIRTDTNPPAGALVFYSWGSYGHVGISIGGGQVISTQGYDEPLPVRQHPVDGAGLPYLGWAPAPDSWPGR